MQISKKNILGFSKEELISYLDELYAKIDEERDLALQAYKSLSKPPEESNESFADEEMLVLMGKTASDYMRLAGDASARLIKIADIKAKVLITDTQVQAKAEKQEILTEQEKNDLLKVVSGGKK
tara:strand:- start:1784 stop:2155 length:372 start_codon:yes stop_codon:yes gene_type:complete